MQGSNLPTVKINESIISLLLKLHSQLSGVPDSYNPDEAEAGSSGGDDNMIGDGPFFVAKLLNKIANLDKACKKCIQDTRNKLWLKQPECEWEQKHREILEREERRRRAKERQQKLMAEFASKQKQFMEKAMETEDSTSGRN